MASGARRPGLPSGSGRRHSLRRKACIARSPFWARCHFCSAPSGRIVLSSSPLINAFQISGPGRGMPGRQELIRLHPHSAIASCASAATLPASRYEQKKRSEDYRAAREAEAARAHRLRVERSVAEPGGPGTGSCGVCACGGHRGFPTALSQANDRVVLCPGRPGRDGAGRHPAQDSERVADSDSAAGGSRSSGKAASAGDGNTPDCRRGLLCGCG